MKYRLDFVTNSSSSSYIVCFARIEDRNKARKVLNNLHNHTHAHVVEYNADEILKMGYIGADWAGAFIYDSDKVAMEHPDDDYIVVYDRNDAFHSDDGEPIYDYNFSINKYIDDISEENGFADVEISEGEGRDG